MRSHLSRIFRVIYFAVLIGCVTNRGSAQDNPTPTREASVIASWGKAAASSSPTVSISGVGNGDIFSIIIEGASAILEPTTETSAPSILSTTFAVQVPFTSKKKSFRFQTDIRGSIHKDADSRVLLMFDFGNGKIRRVEYPYGSAVDLEFIKTYREVPPSNYVFAATILVCRRQPRSVVNASVESIDIAARKQVPGKAATPSPKK